MTLDLVTDHADLHAFGFWTGGMIVFRNPYPVLMNWIPCMYREGYLSWRARRGIFAGCFSQTGCHNQRRTGLRPIHMACSDEHKCMIYLCLTSSIDFPLGSTNGQSKNLSPGTRGQTSPHPLPSEKRTRQRWLIISRGIIRTAHRNWVVIP